MNMHTAERRYLHDAAFHRLVDSLVHMTIELRFSPGELREAAVYAEYRVQALWPERLRAALEREPSE